MRRSTWLIGVGAALLLGALPRVVALPAELWFDEVLSWRLSREAGSPLGVFAVRHDNNHHLNTLWLTLCPDAAPWAWYRLHVLVAGLGAVVLAAIIARRWGEADAVFAAFLFAGNYWLVIAATEARGYALAVLFALAAFSVLRRYLDERRWGWLVLFWLTASLGFLSHLSFVHAYIALVVWSLRHFARERQRPGDELWRMATCHAGVAAFFAPFYLFCVRGMHVEGGLPDAVPAVLGRLLALGLGIPGSLAWLAFVAFGVLFVAGLLRLRREGSDEWVFFSVAAFGSPALFLLRPPPFLYERYFLIPFVFFLLLLAHVLGAWWRARGTRGLAAVLLVGYLVGNGAELGDLLRVGRGRFAAALAWVLEQDSSPVVALTGDDDFRVGRMVEFYAPYFKERGVVYVSNRDPGRAEWVVTHRLRAADPVPDEVTDTAGNVYRQLHAYPGRVRGAWGWFVYRRER